MKRARNDDSSQMIVLMGVVLAFSVFMLASIGAEISNLDNIVTTGQIITLPTEFSNIKEEFGRVLNYNLINVQINIAGPSYADGFPENETILIGAITNLTKAFNQTRDEFHRIELNYGRVFDAHLNRYWYAYKGYGVYSIDITLMLDNGDAKVTEDVVYSIVCRNS